MIAFAILSSTYYGGWLFFVVTIGFIITIWRPAKWCRTASRQVQRLQAIIPSPINAIYGETAAGIAVIRAFGQQGMFMQGRLLPQDHNISSPIELMRSINMEIASRAWSVYFGRWLSSQYTAVFAQVAPDPQSIYKSWTYWWS